MADLEKLQKSLEARALPSPALTRRPGRRLLRRRPGQKDHRHRRLGDHSGDGPGRAAGEAQPDSLALGGEHRQEAAGAQIYLTSVNGAAETGELINIDGTGNRVASGLFGHEKVYFIVGRNKVAPDYDAALWRARNIAAPKNAQRLGRKTPCAAKGDRCYDCKSPERICRALVVYWEKPNSMDMEVVLVDEDLGY